MAVVSGIKGQTKIAAAAASAPSAVWLPPSLALHCIESVLAKESCRCRVHFIVAVYVLVLVLMPPSVRLLLQQHNTHAHPGQI